MTDEFDLGDDEGGTSAGTAPYQILSLSGGGYRGLYTAIVLQKLEEWAGKPLAQAFDLVAGTSIGGILAIGLAAGVPTAVLRKAFEDHGDEIFPRFYRVKGRRVFPRIRLPAAWRRYSPHGLRRTIEAVLAGAPSKMALGDVRTPLLIATVDVTNNGPRLFESSADASAQLIDVALATSAAPTYFPEHCIDKAIFSDGGLIANAPDIVALGQALRLGHARDEVRMLSIGTVGGAGGEAARKPRGRGYVLGAKALFKLTLAAQEKLSIELVSSQLGQQRYLRLDAQPSSGQLAALGLDRTGKKARDTLENLAEQTVRSAEQKHAQALRAMLGRTARWHTPPQRRGEGSRTGGT